jgi:hypothetical protein
MQRQIFRITRNLGSGAQLARQQNQILLLRQ